MTTKRSNIFIGSARSRVLRKFQNAKTSNAFEEIVNHPKLIKKTEMIMLTSSSLNRIKHETVYSLSSRAFVNGVHGLVFKVYSMKNIYRTLFRGLSSE